MVYTEPQQAQLKAGSSDGCIYFFLPLPAPPFFSFLASSSTALPAMDAAAPTSVSACVPT